MVITKEHSWHESTFRALLARKNALPHAMLISGPRGIGKLAFARALARALLCESSGPGPACGECSACLWMENGSHPDYRQLEPASDDGGEEEEGARKTAAKRSPWIKVEHVRALGDFINMTSHRGHAKAVVIHPAEALNVAAANALLKSLEEPPPRTFFLLVAHRPHQLLPTIKSRCQQIALTAPEKGAAAAWLSQAGVAEPELALAHAGGAPLLALELAESDYWSARAAFVRQLAAREIDALSAAEAVQDCPIPFVLAWLQKWIYDMAHYRAVGRVRYNPDQAEAIARAAGAAEPLAAVRFLREMVRLQRVAQHPLNARLFIEELLLGYRDLVQPQTGRA